MSVETAEPLVFATGANDDSVPRFVRRPEARRYGTTNISRFRHGWILLKMSWVAFRRLKLR